MKTFTVGKNELDFVAHELPIGDSSSHYSSSELHTVAKQVRSDIGDEPWEIFVQSTDIKDSPLSVSERSVFLNIIDSRS